MVYWWNSVRKSIKQINLVFEKMRKQLVGTNYFLKKIDFHGIDDIVRNHPSFILYKYFLQQCKTCNFNVEK